MNKKQKKYLKEVFSITGIIVVFITLLLVSFYFIPKIALVVLFVTVWLGVVYVITMDIIQEYKNRG